MSTKNNKKPIPKKQLESTVALEWVVLSVILLWFTAFAFIRVTDSPNLPDIFRVIILIGGYIFALCLPGFIIVKTSFKDTPVETIMKNAVIVTVVLTILRFIEMSIERSDCGQDCAGGMPYGLEILASLSIPVILVSLMYAITLKTTGRSK